MAEIKDSEIVKYKSNKVQLKKAPNQGDNVSVYVRPGDEVDFDLEGINLAELDYKLVGGDIIIDIPNQGSFTFVSMALMGYNDTPPFFNFGGVSQLSLGSILSAIEEVNDLPLESVSASLEVKIDQEAQEDSPEAIPQPIIIVQEITEIKDDDSQDDNEDTPQFTNDAEEVDAVEETIFTDTESKTATAQEDETETETETAVTEGVKPTLTFDIDIQHLKASSSSSGSILTVEGGGGVQYSNIYPGTNSSANRAGIKKQTEAEILDYRHIDNSEASSLVINADNSTYINSTLISRTITLSAQQPVGFAITNISISSSDFPAGFDILNATKSGNIWTIAKDNIATPGIDGFTLDESGNVKIIISMDKNQTKNFEMKIEATTKFNENNIPEELKTKK